MHRITVFVSSTMQELQYERETAAAVIHGLAQHPEFFEIFTARAEAPEQAYVEAVRECDVYVLVVYRSYSDAVMEEYHEAVAIQQENRSIADVVVRMMNSHGSLSLDEDTMLRAMIS